MTTKEALSMAPLKSFGRQVAGGIQVGLGGAVVTGVGIAAQKAFEALTASRDMRMMMKNPYNKDLQEHHDRDPEAFNAAFIGLRKSNLAMAQNPMTAGTYVRRMMTYDPSAAGGVLLDAMQLKDKTPGAFHEAFHEGGRMGVSHTFQEDLRDKGEREKEHRRPQLEYDVMAKTNPLRMEAERDKLDHGAVLRATEAEVAHSRNQELATLNKGHQQEIERFRQNLTIENMPRSLGTKSKYEDKRKLKKGRP